jgi:hypothetical protein
MIARLFAIACLSLGLWLPPAAKAGDVADGPVYWRISNLCLSRRPVLREAPDNRARALAFPAVGTIVKNKGCRIAHRLRWCAVETIREPELQGWMLGACLREAPSQQGQ